MKPIWLPFGLTPKPDNGGIRYADMMARSVAAAIDLVILFTFLSDGFQWLTAYLYGGIDRALLNAAHEAPGSAEALRLTWQSGLPQLWLVNSAIQVAVIGAIIVTVQCVFHTTPGKWLLGLKILRANTMEAPSRLRYALRFLAYIPSALPLMLGVIWASFNKERRCWHDMLVGTVVIHTRPQHWLWYDLKRGAIWLWKRLRSVPPMGKNQR